MKKEEVADKMYPKVTRLKMGKKGFEVKKEHTEMTKKEKKHYDKEMFE